MLRCSCGSSGDSRTQWDQRGFIQVAFFSMSRSYHRFRADSPYHNLFVTRYRDLLSCCWADGGPIVQPCPIYSTSRFMKQSGNTKGKVSFHQCHGEKFKNMMVQGHVRSSWFSQLRNTLSSFIAESRSPFLALMVVPLPTPEVEAETRLDSTRPLWHRRTLLSFPPWSPRSRR